MGIHFPVNHKLYRLLFVMIAYGMVLIGAIAGCGSPHVSQMSIHSPLPRALPQQQTDLDTNRTFTSPTFESPLEMTGAPQIETQELFIHNTVSSATSLAFDDYYLYFNSNAGLLCRTPLAGGDTEIVMTNEYWQIDLTPFFSPCTTTLNADPFSPAIFRLKQSEEWLLFVSRAMPSLYSPHTVYAYHMPTGISKAILRDQDDSSLDAYAVVGDWAVLVILDFLEGDPNCQGNSIVTMINLATDERQELYRGCIRDAFYYDPFAGVALTEEWIALVRRYSDALGGSSEIVLWNRQTNTQQVISGDGYSRFPAMSGDWVAWLVAPENHEIGPDSPEYTVLHQISTGWQQQLYPAYGTDEPHLTDGRWLYLA